MPRRRVKLTWQNILVYAVVLIITLVMLIMLTLLALSAMNTSTTNLQMVGNSQARSEALDATQLTIERAISTPDFVETPANAIPGSCAPNTMCIDLNGDGVAELESKLLPQPYCTQARIIKIDEARMNIVVSRRKLLEESRERRKQPRNDAEQTADQAHHVS